MPEIKLSKPPKLEHGTISEVTAILREQGECIGYQAVQKRIMRLSHYETIKLAMQVSRRLKEERESRAAKIVQIINDETEVAR